MKKLTFAVVALAVFAPQAQLGQIEDVAEIEASVAT